MNAKIIIEHVKTALENDYNETILEQQINGLLAKFHLDKSTELFADIKETLTQAEREEFWGDA